MIPACRWCGVWVCGNCGAHRDGANRFGHQPCPKKCGAPDDHGTMIAMKHVNEAKREDHDETFRSLIIDMTLIHPLKEDE